MSSQIVLGQLEQPREAQILESEGLMACKVGGNHHPSLSMHLPKEALGYLGSPEVCDVALRVKVPTMYM